MLNYSESKQTLKENLPVVTWRNVFLLIVLTPLMLVLTNFFMLEYLDRYSMNYGYWTIHQKWNLLAELETPVDWLILGDSSCSQGVIPDIFKMKLNQTALNLCTTGDMGTVDNLWLLEDYIERFGVPKNVLIVHTFDIWYRGFNPVRLGQVPRPWRFWERHSFGIEFMRDEDTREETFIERYMPLLSQNKTIGTIIRSTLAGVHNPLVSMWTITENGFVPALEPKPDTVLAGEQQLKNFVVENSFTISSINDQALNKIVELADRNGFYLYIANAPVYEGLYASVDFQNYNQSLQSHLQNIADQSDNTYHIPSIKTFPIEQMQNPDHLIVSGAEEYTEWLIKQIQQFEK
jgi:hypothetical protein